MWTKSMTLDITVNEGGGGGALQKFGPALPELS